jgi:hypothetical protein
MKRCSYCDHFNPDDAVNCERCGGELERGRTSPREAEPEADDSPPVAPAGGQSSIEDEVLQIAREAGKIPAIKVYRELTGAGLKEAKDAVEAILARHGVQSKATGCGTAVLLLVACAALVWRAVAG